MASMKREAAGDGALMEWQESGSWRTHIWIYLNKFFIHIKREGCVAQMVYFSSTINNQQWYTMALFYDVDADEVSMWVDGQLSPTQLSPCASRKLLTPDVAYINIR